MEVPGFEAVDEDEWLHRMDGSPAFLGLRSDSPGATLLDGDWNGYARQQHLFKATFQDY